MVVLEKVSDVHGGLWGMYLLVSFTQLLHTAWQKQSTKTFISHALPKTNTTMEQQPFQMYFLLYNYNCNIFHCHISFFLEGINHGSHLELTH